MGKHLPPKAGDAGLTGLIPGWRRLNELDFSSCQGPGKEMWRRWGLTA